MGNGMEHQRTRSTQGKGVAWPIHRGDWPGAVGGRYVDGREDEEYEGKGHGSSSSKRLDGRWHGAPPFPFDPGKQGGETLSKKPCSLPGGLARCSPCRGETVQNGTAAEDKQHIRVVRSRRRGSGKSAGVVVSAVVHVVFLS